MSNEGYYYQFSGVEDLLSYVRASKVTNVRHIQKCIEVSAANISLAQHITALSDSDDLVARCCFDCKTTQLPQS